MYDFAGTYPRLDEYVPIDTDFDFEDVIRMKKKKGGTFVIFYILAWYLYNVITWIDFLSPIKIFYY